MPATGAHISGWRRSVATILVIVASLLAFLAIFAIWLNRQALNTDNWTQTSSELLEQPVVRNQLAARLTDQLFEGVDVEQAVEEALPERAQALAAPAANALRTQVEKTARKALQRPDVQAAWADANRSAHEELMAVLDGGGTTVSTEGGTVVLDAKQLLALLQERVGVGGRLRKVLPASATQIGLFKSDDLGTAQDVVRVLRRLPVVLIVASLALVAVAMAVAPGWRRRALRAFGIGFVLAGVGALLVRSVAGDAFVSSLTSTAAAEPPVEQVWTIATGLLVDVAVAAIAYGLVMIVGAWCAGATRSAVAMRRFIAPYLREPVIAYSSLALVIAGLIWWAPTPAWRNGPLLLILVVLLVLGVEALRRQVIREHPTATRAEAARRHRERRAALLEAGRRRGEALRASASRTAHSAAAAVPTSREPATAPVTSPEDVRLERLERLASLRQAGILDDDELRVAKERIMNGAADTLPAT
jgi:hypothetical protein